MKSSDVEKALKKLSSKERAILNTRYFKTGKGEYGEGDIFLGVTVPNARAVSREFSNLQNSEVTKLLRSKIHEHRLVALFILVLKFERANKNGDDVEEENIARLYLRNLRYINNWDLVDASAHYILGRFLFTRSRAELYRLAKSKDLWERRVAIVSTMHFILQKDFKDTLAITEILLKDRQDLIQKACGWMLREVGKKDEKVLTNFLEKYASVMPRTMLRYCLERLSESKRQYFMKKK